VFLRGGIPFAFAYLASLLHYPLVVGLLYYLIWVGVLYCLVVASMLHCLAWHAYCVALISRLIRCLALGKPIH